MPSKYNPESSLDDAKNLAKNLGIEFKIIEIEDIGYKRPGGNLNPEMTDFIVGRTINKDIESDHILTKEDIV